MMTLIDTYIGCIGLHVVPRTEVVTLASPSFYYSRTDRPKDPLPPKIGSLQLYMFGFMDATKFLRKSPRMLEDGRRLRDPRSGSLHPTIKEQFQNEFEKMIIIDYIIRNTDRGLDNWMVSISGEPVGFTWTYFFITFIAGQIPWTTSFGWYTRSTNSIHSRTQGKVFAPNSKYTNWSCDSVIR
jgi:hypothetical protein